MKQSGLHWSTCRPGANAIRAIRPRGSTPPDTTIYVIGDIHGRHDLLDRIQRGIAADAAMRRAPRKLIVYLGDYLSRGKESHRVVYNVSTWRPDTCGSFDVVTLKGNHEDLALRYLQGDLIAGQEWLEHGGLDALAAYGIDAGRAEMCNRESMETLRRRFADALPAQDLEFLLNLKHSHREGDYYFVHAGIFPGIPLEAQSEHDQMWIRERFLQSEADHGAIVVHGHSISATPDIRHNRIGIDTGAYDSGVLTCLVLDGEEQALLQTCPCIAEDAACSVNTQQASSRTGERLRAAFIQTNQFHRDARNRQSCR